MHMQTQTVIHITIFSFAFMLYSHKYPSPQSLQSHSCKEACKHQRCKMERRFSESVIWQSLTQHIFFKAEQRQSGNATAEIQSSQPPSESWSISQSNHTNQVINPFFCNNSQHQSALCKSISSHSQPSPSQCSTPSPLRHPISAPHLSFICALRGTSLFSFPAPFKTVSLVSTFPTDCALTLQKSKGVLSVLIIHVWWEAPASLHCKLRKKCLYSTVSVCVCPCSYYSFLCQCVCLYLKHTSGSLQSGSYFHMADRPILNSNNGLTEIWEWSKPVTLLRKKSDRIRNTSSQMTLMVLNNPPGQLIPKPQ